MKHIIEFAEMARSLIGVEHRVPLGEVRADMSMRYALAVGSEDTLALDLAAARNRGLQGVLALPNYITAVQDWSAGSSRAVLREDGTSGSHLPHLDTSGFRVMGGGEDTRFYHDVVSGMILSLVLTLMKVETKKGRLGDFVVLTYHDRFLDDTGTCVVESTRRMVVR